MLAALRHRNFALLWLAGLISVAGDFALIVALPLHVYRLTGSTLATAGTLAAGSLPRVLAGSVAGVFVDRWDRRRTMVVADLLRALALLPLLIAPTHLGIIYAVAAVEGTIGLFFSPAEGALLPRLVGEEHLVAANALNALNDNLGMLIGPALGAFLYAESGIGGVVLADAATYVGSALLIGLIRVGGRESEVGSRSPTSDLRPPTRVLGEWRDGLRIVGRDRAMRVLFVAGALSGLAEGIFLTLGLSPLVLDVLGGTPASSPRPVYRPSPWAGRSSPGRPFVAASTGRQALVQTRVADAYRRRVFGALGAVVGGAMLARFALGGVLGGVAGLVPTLSAGGLVRAGGGLLVLWLLPRQEERPSTNQTVDTAVT